MTEDHDNMMNDMDSGKAMSARAQEPVDMGVQPYDALDSALEEQLTLEHSPADAVHNPPSKFDTQNNYDFEPGTVIDNKYVIVRLLGKGGMGVVYQCTQLNISRDCAVKVIRNSLLASQGKEKVIARFRHEAILAATIRHPHIVGVYDLGEDRARNFHYIAMQFVDGKSLREIQQRIQRLTEEEAQVIIYQVAEVLSAASAQRIVHRDIKPDNIMLSRTGEVKVTDLGIAMLIDNRRKRARKPSMIGTPAYISPEQALDSDAVDGRADIYSLGATFYHFVTGKPVYEAKTDKEVIYKQIYAEVPSPNKLSPGLSASTGNLIRRMLAKSPSERFTPAELVAYMEENNLVPPENERLSIKLNLFQRAFGAEDSGEPVQATDVNVRSARRKKGKVWKVLFFLLLFVVLVGVLWKSHLGVAEPPPSYTLEYYEDFLSKFEAQMPSGGNGKYQIVDAELAETMLNETRMLLKATQSNQDPELKILFRTRFVPWLWPAFECIKKRCVEMGAVVRRDGSSRERDKLRQMADCFDRTYEQILGDETISLPPELDQWKAQVNDVMVAIGVREVPAKNLPPQPNDFADTWGEECRRIISRLREETKSFQLACRQPSSSASDVEYIANKWIETLKTGQDFLQNTILDGKSEEQTRLHGRLRLELDNFRKSGRENLLQCLKDANEARTEMLSLAAGIASSKDWESFAKDVSSKASQLEKSLQLYQALAERLHEFLEMESIDLAPIDELMQFRRGFETEVKAITPIYASMAKTLEAVSSFWQELIGGPEGPNEARAQECLMAAQQANEETRSRAENTSGLQYLAPMVQEMVTKAKSAVEKAQQHASQ